MGLGQLRGTSLLVGSALLLCLGASRAPARSAPKPVAPPHDQLACKDCHESGEPPGGPVTCTSGGCHAAQAAEFLTSEHDQRNRKDLEPRLYCTSCHGGHEMTERKVAACEQQFDRTCLGCHPTDRYTGLPHGRPRPAGLADSIHAAVRLSRGCAAAPLTCFTCHGPHTVRPASDPESPVARLNIDATCGSCHAREEEQYRQSVHGKGLAAGSAYSPTCVTCHGAHRILAVGAGGGRTAVGRVVYTCGGCHEDLEVTRSAHLREGVVESYESTFHGKAYEEGATDVAQCVSCHGDHDVLPTSDPRSRTNPKNLEATCLSCHQKVDERMLAAAGHPGEWRGLGWAIKRLNLYFPVAGTALNPLFVSGMGALVGFLSGLFGVGGGFLMTPLLIFIGIPAAVAAATDAAQITAGASSGALSHSRLGNVDFKMGLVIVIGGWTGGYAGVRLVALLRQLGNFDFFLKAVYVIVLGFIGISMFIEGVRTLRGRADSDEPGHGRLARLFGRLPLQTSFPKSALKTSILLPITAGFMVGVLAAFLGVGGGFIMLPMMIYIIGMPTRVAVGTDLFQIVLTSANVALQQAAINHTVDILLAVTLFAGSVIGAQFGVRACRHLRGEQIRVFLAIIVLVVMGLLLYQLLSTPDNLIGFARSGGGH